MSPLNYYYDDYISAYKKYKDNIDRVKYTINENLRPIAKYYKKFDTIELGYVIIENEEHSFIKVFVESEDSIIEHVTKKNKDIMKNIITELKNFIVYTPVININNYVYNTKNKQTIYLDKIIGNEITYGFLSCWNDSIIFDKTGDISPYLDKLENCKTIDTLCKMLKNETKKLNEINNHNKKYIDKIEGYSLMRKINMV